MVYSMVEGLFVYLVVSNLLMIRFAEVFVTQLSLAVMIMAVLCKQQRQCCFAVLAQTLHFMMLPSYIGAGLLFAHPCLCVSLMSCLCGLYFLTRGAARLLNTFLQKDRRPQKDKVDWKRARLRRKKLAKARRRAIFQHGSRWVLILMKEAGLKISGLTCLHNGLPMVSGKG